MNKLLTLLAAAVIGLSLPSCTTTGAFPFLAKSTNVTASSYTVQAAEKALKQAKLTFDLFFGLVHDNHAFVVAHLPTVYAFAQKMQVEAPDALRKANAAKNVFKSSRDPSAQTTLNGLMATLMQIQTDVLANTNQIKSATGTP